MHAEHEHPHATACLCKLAVAIEDSPEAVPRQTLHAARYVACSGRVGVRCQLTLEDELKLLRLVRQAQIKARAVDKVLSPSGAIFPDLPDLPSQSDITSHYLPTSLPIFSDLPPISSDLRGCSRNQTRSPPISPSISPPDLLRSPQVLSQSDAILIREAAKSTRPKGAQGKLIEELVRSVQSETTAAGVGVALHEVCF